MKVCSTLKFGLIVLLFASVAQAQSIDISKFYYRDYLDFGQNKGAFSGNGSTTITGKDGTEFKIPQTPNFSASSNNGNLAAVGRGFVVTANHVTSPENPASSPNLRKWGLTEYTISSESATSQGYGRDEKFFRFDKYIVEGQAQMLNVENSLNSANLTKEEKNIQNFKNELANFKDDKGNIYLYQAGSGVITLRGNTNTNIDRIENGETKGGGFGTLGQDSIKYECLVQSQSCDSRGIMFNYNPNLDSGFNNRITSGDSGSGIYAYDNTNKKWVLLGVTSQEWSGQNRAFVSLVSNKDFESYQSKFEQTINLKMTEPNLNKWMLSNTTLEYDKRGDTPNSSHTLQNNKDIIFSGGGTIEVQGNIYRNISGYAGGFVFTADSSATSAKPTTYTFTNANGQTYLFKGSGLDIGENVKVEWALRNDKNDALHKIGKGELVITTKNTETTGLGTLKIGEGKVTLNTNTKAFDNIYITSGRGELALKKDRAEALGATKNSTNSASSTTSANSYTLSQDKNSEMGFYFGKGGGKFDLAGNSLVLNTIAANDSKAIITNSDTGQAVNLEIQGYGYKENGEKDSTQKADTIIHASIGEISPSPAEGDKGGGSNTQNSGQANINIKYSGNRTTQNVLNATLPLAPSAREGESQSASLIFDGHINIKGELKAENANIVLQGHPTTHATISDEKIREQIKKAESGTSQKMPDYMDLSKPSTLNQPDWDSRNFSIKQGITLTNTTLTVGKAANLNANITADKDSQINFGGKHFIDERDGKNIGGSGFSYYQLVTSGDLLGETYKDSSYSGTIKADGTKITSQFFNFTPNLELSNNASLKATNLTLNTNSKLNLSGNSSAEVENLIFKGFQNGNDFASKFKLDGSKFEVKESFTFDNSTFDLSKLSSTASLTLPTEYNLYAFNGSTITTANEFKNTKENAEFMLDSKSTFNATSVSFQSTNLNLNLSNSSTMSINSFKSTGETSLIIRQGSTLKTTDNMSFDKATIKLANDKSNLNAKNLTLNEKSSIILDDKATLTLENALSSKDLTLTLSNASTFTAKTLTASGVLNLNADEKSKITLTTLDLQKGNLQNISQNVDITTLKLTDSTANLQDLKTNLPQSITLNKQSTLQLNELNLNTNSINLTSDDSSKAHIKKLIYDTTKAQANGANTAPQSNLSVSELFKLDNVGKNLGTTTGTTQGTPSTEQEKLEKDLFALEFSQKLELGSGAKLDISFADKVTKDSKDLIFGKDYTIFTAKNLLYNDNFNNITFNLAGSGTDFFVKGRLDKNNNAFFVQFVRENPRNFSKLNPYINPTYSPLLEILLQHNKNDESIEKVVNMSDYTALNQRLAQIDTSLKTIANADSAALKTLPLLQKQEINARIQQNRFTTAKFALAKITNPAQKSDIVPTLLYLDENERQNRVWSGASASFFSNDSDKFSLQSVSIGYDRKLFGDEFLLGILASLTNTQLSSDETSLNPKIYTLALYSDALFRHGELQNELSFSLLNGDKGFESESGSYKSFYGFFESVYKVQTAFLPQSIKPIVLGRVNLRHFDEFSTATYKQKADDDISVDLGVGVEWLWQKESGFYSASFVAERDIYHSQKERLMSLTGAQKFVAYETNEPSFAYQLYLAGLENFKNGIYLRYGLSGFVDSKAYKGFKADVQVGYRF